MESYVFLLSIAVILLSTKILGDATNKVNLTQVVGALLAGVLLGPSCLGLITETDFIAKTAEIGVILLMFTAGLDTDIQEMKKNSVACIVIASIGVLVPLLGGTACYYFFFIPGSTSYNDILKAVFVGYTYCHICKHYRRGSSRDGQTGRQGWKRNSWSCGNR